MWSDRYVVYYSKEHQYAVRWRQWTDPEEKARFRKFEAKVDAERFYNHLVDTQHEPGGPIELFFSQAKWVRYHEADTTVEPSPPTLGNRSTQCSQGLHDACRAGLAEVCACACHLTIT